MFRHSWYWSSVLYIFYVPRLSMFFDFMINIFFVSQIWLKNLSLFFIHWNSILNSSKKLHRHRTCLRKLLLCLLFLFGGERQGIARTGTKWWEMARNDNEWRETWNYASIIDICRILYILYIFYMSMTSMYVIFKTISVN